jgi:hypothetical protein
MLGLHRQDQRPDGDDLRKTSMANRLTVLLFTVVLISGLTSVHAQCECHGKLVANYDGGRNDPLRWFYNTYLVQEGRMNSQPLICYERTVINGSNANVLNILWNVAGYRRRSIPSKRLNSSCVTLAGEMALAPASGPLHYGVSSEQYDTTVHPPREGWLQAAATRPTDWPLIRSAFEVYVHDNLWAVITIHSSAAVFDDRTYILTYEIENLY